VRSSNEPRCGHDAVSDFEKLHSGAYDHQVFLYGFDLLELNGEDYRREPLEKRKASFGKAARGSDRSAAIRTFGG
jgi:ATP-dependent DNA ligase